jgi:hypothetical protein
VTTHRFTGRLFAWDEDQPDSWVFLALPAEVSDLVEEESVGSRRGFGSVRVGARLGQSTWETSVFPSKEHGTYLLPIRRAVRRAEGVTPGDTVEVAVTVVR